MGNMKVIKCAGSGPGVILPWGVWHCWGHFCSCLQGAPPVAALGLCLLGRPHNSELSSPYGQGQKTEVAPHFDLELFLLPEDLEIS